MAMPKKSSKGSSSSGSYTTSRNNDRRVSTSKVVKVPGGYVAKKYIQTTEARALNQYNKEVAPGARTVAAARRGTAAARRRVK